MSIPSLADIYKAKEFIQGKILYTPLVKFNNGEKSLFIKAESLHEVGSFKIRGAMYAISTLSDAQRKHGVIAYSTGNHAQAVALAASLQGIKSTIVMSPTAPAAKIAATKRFGADIIMVEPSSEIRRQTAEQLAKEKGLSIIPPYDDPRVIAGQGTIGLEILEQYPEVNTVIVPIGGGGLIAGIAMAIKEQRPHVKIIGVEPELENDAYQSFQQKKIITLASPSNTLAEAVVIQRVGELPFQLIQRYVDTVDLVSETEIIQAMFLAAQYSRLLLEPAGAIALAYTLKQPTIHNSHTVVIGSGGNFPLAQLCQLQAK